MPKLVPVPTPEAPEQDFVGTVIEISPPVTGTLRGMSWQTYALRKNSTNELVHVAISTNEMIRVGDRRRRIEKGDDIVGQINAWDVYSGDFKEMRRKTVGVLVEIRHAAQELMDRKRKKEQTEERALQRRQTIKLVS